MPYIALKHVKFDREYMIGETIPDHVVDPSRAAALVGMKLIAAIPAAESSQEPTGAAQGEDKADATQTDGNGAEGAQKPAGDAAESSQEPEKKSKSKK